jgi:gluconolactonase
MPHQAKVLTLCALLVACAPEAPEAIEEADTSPLPGPLEVASEVQIERLDPRFDQLVPADPRVEVLGEGIQWAEGPVWNPADSSVLVSDVIANVIYRWKEGEGMTRYLEPSGYTGTEPFTGREPGSNGLILDGEGRLILARHGDRQIVRREHDGTFTVLASEYQGRRLNSPNDLVFGPNGDIYFTDPPYGLPNTFQSAEKELPHNGVYRLRPDGTVELLTAELNAPNGIAVSPDGSTLYVSSTDREQRFWMAYPLAEDGSIGEGRIFRAPEESGPGGQDGMDVDIHGNVWATGPGGVHVIAPDGTLLGRIVTGVPTANVTWGDDGSMLYIAANDRLLRMSTTTQGFPGFQNQ